MLTHQQKIEAIRRACVKANPKIVELKFGCLISGYGHHLSEIVTVGEKYCSFLHSPDLVAQDRTKTIKQDYEIIGRPIRLADVLLVFRGRSLKGCDPNETYPSRNEISILQRWNIRNDDLSKQSEDTVDFIHELLA